MTDHRRPRRTVARRRPGLPGALLLILLLPFAAAAAEPSPPAAAQAESGVYRLGPRDQLMIRVGQWQGSEGRYVAWEDVGGEYIVGPDGMVSLPLVGAVPAAGRTTGELGDDVSDLLQQRVGLSDELRATVEILEFRPVYVLGGVNKPGAYPFAPGLTVIQAIGLAGGLDRRDSVFVNSERSALSSLGSFEVFRLALWRNLAREARLEAELADEETIETPPRVAEAPLAEELMQIEREIKKARDSALESSISQIESLETLLSEQIERLGEQVVLRARQVELARKELADVATLMDKGLTVASRQNALERTVADLEAQKLELETAKLRAEQQLNEAGRDRLELSNERRGELVTSLSEARGEIHELEAKMETERALFAEASRLGTGFVRPEGVDTAPVFNLIRRNGEAVESFVVDRTAALLPGDVLEVQPPELGRTMPYAPGMAGAGGSGVTPLDLQGVGALPSAGETGDAAPADPAALLAPALGTEEGSEAGEAVEDETLSSALTPRTGTPLQPRRSAADAGREAGPLDLRGPGADDAAPATGAVPQPVPRPAVVGSGSTD